MLAEKNRKTFEKIIQSEKINLLQDFKNEINRKFGSVLHGKMTHRHIVEETFTEYKEAIREEEK